MLVADGDASIPLGLLLLLVDGVIAEAPPPPYRELGVTIAAALIVDEVEAAETEVRSGGDDIGTGIAATAAGTAVPLNDIRLLPGKTLGVLMP
jgi:hypothetical protein